VTEYQGIPLEDLEINEIAWTDADAEHIRTRSKRKHENEVDIEPEWATEAALDLHRRVAPASSGPSLEVVGYSQSLCRVVKVWLLPVDLEAGVWAGKSAAVVKRAHERAYWDHRNETNDE
jgi:hypothetical protein